MDKKFISSLFFVLAVGVAVGFYLSSASSNQHAIAQGPPGGSAPGGPAGWTDDGAVVRLTTESDKVGIGTVSPAEKLEVIGNIAISGLINGIDLSAKAIDWDTAFVEKRQWNGGSDNLNPSLGRESLGLGSLATLNAVNGGVGGTITDKTISEADLSALNHVILKDTDGSNCHKITVNSSGVINTIAVDCAMGEPIQPVLFSDNFETYSDGALTSKNGGTGWTNSWSANAYNVQGNVVFEGLKAVENQGITSTADRGFNPITGSGIFRIRMRRTTIDSGKFVAILRENGIAKASVHLAPSGVVTSGGGIVAGFYLANTWHTLFISFDIQRDKYQVKIDNGSWTQEESFQNGGMANRFDELRVEFDPAAGTAYFDEVIAFPN